jgi:A-macroglobulin receptor binding domain
MEVHKGGTLVRVYLNNVKGGKQCLKIKARKLFGVQNEKKASIKVYQYDIAGILL